jgi:hypothetical protein
VCEPRGVEPEHALPAGALAAHEPGIGERVEVLGDRLARDARAVRQRRDRLRAVVAEAVDDAQAAAPRAPRRPERRR